jgi:hypothetical protein
VKPLGAIWASANSVQKEPEQIYSGDIVFLRHIWCRRRRVRREFIQMTGAITEKARAPNALCTYKHQNFHLANGVRRAEQRDAKRENVCGLEATL